MNAFASFLKKLYIDIELHMPDSTTDSPILRDTHTLGKQKKRGKYRKSLQKFSGYPQENSKLAHKRQVGAAPIMDLQTPPMSTSDTTRNLSF